MTRLGRRTFMGGLAAGAAAVAGGISPVRPGRGAHAAATAARGLREPAFWPLPLGSIRPRGWLARQLRIQAHGLSGHLDEFWPDVGQSRWFGGDAEGWERAPYWLDGVIPLAWGLDDAGLKDKVAGYVRQIVARQRADGWFEPVPADPAAKPYDMWAILLVQKVLAQYH